MAQITQLEITFYKGVPFNNKYQNVLFVDNVSRETFLNNYKVGQPVVIQKRFEIINETEAFFDITNNYDCFECNYLKVHSILAPETSLTVTERDTFYFVNSVRQITTNTVRLFLEIDIFQTFFNKYDYANQIQVIPEVKKSRCVVSTDFASADERYSIINGTNYSHYNFSNTPLVPQTQSYSRVRAVMHFSSTTGEYVAISQNAFVLAPATGTFPDTLGTLLDCIFSSKQLYMRGSTTNIDVLNVYLIPAEMFDNATFTDFDTAYYDLGNNPDIHLNFYISFSTGVTVSDFTRKTIAVIKTVTPEIDTQYSVGTNSRQIQLPYNSKTYYVTIQFVIGNDFKIYLKANNEILEITDEFELTILQSQYGQYIQQHKNGLAIKGISNILSLMFSVGGLFAGQPSSLMSLTSAMTNTASEYANISDLKEQPLKVTGQSSIMTNLIYNGIAIFKNKPFNKDEILKSQKYFGEKIDYLTDKTFVYIPDAIGNVQYNFDYYKFSNVEIVGEFAETYKSRIEQMFLDGIRLWYRTDNFLQTIENKETITP